MVVNKSNLQTGLPSSIREALPQVIAVCVKNLLLLAYGTTLGFPTILIPALSGNDGEGISLVDEELSWIGSLNLICVPLGCIFSGTIAQPFGRRKAMQALNIPLIAAWVIFHYSTQVWHLFAALCIIGVTGGLLEAPVLTYVAEITQPHLRGILSSTSTMAVNSGILSSFLLGTFLPWRTTVLVNCIVPAVSFVLLMFIPESPHWLVSKSRFTEAKESLAWLRGWTTKDDAVVQEEFRNLCEQFDGTNKNALEFVRKSSNIQRASGSNESSEKDPIIKKKSKLKLFANQSFLWPFSIVSFAFFLGHFTGNTTLQVYAIRIFVSLNVPINKYYATILVGVVQIFGVVLCVTCISFYGKRIMTFISLIGLGTCFVVVATYSYVKGMHYLKVTSDDLGSKESWIPLIFLVMSAFFAFICIKGLPWILIGEVYNNETKATAAGFSGGLGYVFGFAANKTFLTMVSTITLPGVFWLYGGVAYVGCILMYFVLPETEGKSLFDISEHFAGRGKLGNQIKNNDHDVKEEAYKSYEEGEKVETKF